MTGWAEGAEVYLAAAQGRAAAERVVGQACWQAGSSCLLDELDLNVILEVIAQGRAGRSRGFVS